MSKIALLLNLSTYTNFYFSILLPGREIYFLDLVLAMYHVTFPSTKVFQVPPFKAQSIQNRN